MDEKVLKNGHRNVLIKWNGRKWDFTTNRNRKYFTITNANKKNGYHRLVVTPQRAYLNYSHGWFLGMRKPNPTQNIKNRINVLQNWMNRNPINIGTAIYRGIPKRFTDPNNNNFNSTTNYSRKMLNQGYLNSNSFISFSKNPLIAKGYGLNGIVVVLPPGRYPAVENGRNGFATNMNEREVVLAPGRLTLVNRNPNANGRYKVTYTRKK